MEKLEHSPVVFQVVRYGLPLVIVIFYVTASWRFSYTPDSTFLSLRMTQQVAAEGEFGSMDGHGVAAPNPLWPLFLAIGALLQLDIVLTSKIFSLFFSCLSLLLGYLVAAELLRDRLFAFCAALALATSGWLLQAAPSGSALPLALALVLAALFFMLRNEYLLSALMLGLATLLFWQAVAAMVILLWDVWWNSSDPRRRTRMMLSSALLYVCVLLPWLLFSGVLSAPPIPWLVPLGDFPTLSWPTGLAAALPAVVAAAGAIATLRSPHHDAIPRKSHVIVVIWAAWFVLCAALWGWDYWLMALPVIIVYAFAAIQQYSAAVRPGSSYMQAFLLTGILILLHQGAFTVATRPVMARTEKDSGELAELAYWVKNGVPDEATVSAENPYLLAYYSGRPVSPWDPAGRASTDYVVSAEEEVWGYDAVHRASSFERDELLAGAGRFAVWRRR